MAGFKAITTDNRKSNKVKKGINSNIEQVNNEDDISFQKSIKRTNYILDDINAMENK